ncbi:hypothetical protein [Spirosoma sp.]|uniref:hypothetical protein n=1 Tax=Spirosoma sp. TaxID=1899569 RepID=UPI002602220E|nr:hypothetical protein [Spirosoma sp.]MCX6217610.1 hypothetical protein [Spirosoma sp.]
MVLTALRTWITNTFGLNGSGAIDGSEIQTALLELCGQIEQQTSWTPVFTTVADGLRVVIKITDWTGGVGVKPAVNVYLSSGGLTSVLASATDFKGATGSTGSAGTASASSLLSVSAANPTTGILAKLVNTATSAWTGARLVFEKTGVAVWRMGLPASNDDAFIIEGWGVGTYPEYLRIDSVGNMGVGTPNPAEKVDVNGNVQSRSTTAPKVKLFLDQADNAITNGTFGELQFVASNAAKKYAAIRGIVGGFSDIVGLSFWTTFAGTYAESARLTADGNLGVGTTTPSEKVDVNGRVRAKGIVTFGSSPTITPGSGLGTSGTTASVASGSNDVAGKVTLTTTPGVAVNSTMATIAFNTPYAAAPKAVLLAPRNARMSDEQGRIYVSSITASGFVISSGSTALSQPYSFDIQYTVIS